MSTVHKAADCIIAGGVIRTMDPHRPEAEAIAISGGRIVYVGDSAGARELVGPHTETINLRGRVALPGFVESHTHLGFFGWTLGQTDCRELRSVDMKGGLAAIAALRRTGVEMPGDIWLLASVDEEAEMLGVKAMVASDTLASVGAAIICEPTSLRVAHVCKGRTWATLRVLGQTAHASLRGAGVNAISHGVRLAAALEGATPDHRPHELAGESWWAVTEIEGGIEPAIVPDRCDLTLDVRLVPGQTTAGIWNEVQAVIDRLATEIPDFRCEVDVVERREPWEVDPDGAVTSAMAAGMRGATGGDAELFAFPGTTDASYLVPAGVPCVVCGPGDLTRAHRENEGVLVAELNAAARAYALAAVEFFALTGAPAGADVGRDHDGS